MSEGMHQHRQQQPLLSGSRILRATLRPAPPMVGDTRSSLTPIRVAPGAPVEPSAVGSMPMRPVAELCSSVSRTASPMRMIGIPDMIQQQVSSPVQDGRIVSTPLLHQTHCSTVYQGGPATPFPVTAPRHASPHPLQPRVLAAGAKLGYGDESTPGVVEDGCGNNGGPLQIQRPPLEQFLCSSLPQSVPTAAQTFPLQAGEDDSELQQDDSQLFLLEQLTDIGKSIDIINRSSNASEERCLKSESAITEIRASIQDLWRDVHALQSRFFDKSEVPALGSVHNDMETLRTQHLYALGAIEEQRQEHNQLHTMHGELRQLLTDHGKGLQNLQARAQSDIRSETSLISNMQQQQARQLQELEAQVAKHMQNMAWAPALPADQHHRFQTEDSSTAEFERQEQTRALAELTEYLQETRQEIFSTVDSAFDEVRSEIKALSEQVNNRVPHQVSTVIGINGGISTVGEPELATGICGGPLRISILGAAGLRNADWFGKSDPYCTCEILAKPATKIKTHVIKNNLDPTWDYEAELPEFEAGDCLVFKVYDEDFGKKDDFLGTLLLMSEQFYPHGFEGALPLQEAGKGITANLRLRIPPATVVNPIAATQPLAEAPSQRLAAPGQEDPAVAELQEQLGCLTQAVRNEFNGLHESFELISSRVQGAEMALGGPHVVQLAAALENEMAKRVESEALLQHELASVAVRVEQLSHHGPVDGERPGLENPAVQLALTKAEQSLVASSNLQDEVHDMQQEVLKLAEQQIHLEGGLAGLEDLRTNVGRIRAELSSPLEEY